MRLCKHQKSTTRILKPGKQPNRICTQSYEINRLCVVSFSVCVRVIFFLLGLVHHMRICIRLERCRNRWIPVQYTHNMCIHYNVITREIPYEISKYVLCVTVFPKPKKKIRILKNISFPPRPNIIHTAIRLNNNNNWNTQALL